MSERERSRPPRPLTAGEVSDSGEGLEEARERAQRLLQSADQAIARALSGDSEQFLRATRQSGGQ